MSKKSAKKIIIGSLILMLALSVVLFFGACGEEAEEADYGYFKFSHSEALGGLVLDRVEINKLPKNVTVPSRYYADGDSGENKIEVVAIADGVFADCAKITSVTLPDTLKSIGAGAFSGCNALTDINLDSVNKIGKDAFRNCKELTAASFSPSLTDIPESAFAGCIKLRTVGGMSQIKNIGTDAFRSCTTLMNLDVDLTALESIGGGAFFFTGCLTTFEVPSSCVSVGSHAFQGWTEYQTVYYTSSDGWDANWNSGTPESVFVTAKK